MVLILSDAPPAARTPWLPFQGPIPPVRVKCPEGTKGGGMLSAKQTERSMQIWYDLSVSAAPSHLPWKGRLWNCASLWLPLVEEGFQERYPFTNSKRTHI